MIHRAAHIFDKVIVAVAQDTQKNLLFSTPERVAMVQHCVTGIKNVTVESFKGLVINYARAKNISVLIRGVRMFSDFEYELQMALTNRRLGESIETVFLMPSEGNSFLSSTLIKEAVSLGADVTSFVPEFVAQRLKEKLNEGIHQTNRP